MDSSEVDILDTKVVNNITYKLVKRVENGIKMKLWIPEYLVNKGNNITGAMKSVNLTQDEKVHHLYNQLKKFSVDEVESLQSQIVKLDLDHLPRSHKNEISSMITRMIQLYQNERKICHALVRKLRLWIQQEELVNKRRQQLTLLFCLQEEINLVSKSVKKIEIHNNVDMEIVPFTFSYINSITPGPQVSFPENPPIGCDCVGKRSCFLNKCCPEMFNRQTTYNEFGEVMVPPQVAIYECNKSCRCAKLCTNRVVQRGSNVKLAIFRKINSGWGVRAAEFIKKNSFVIEFTGEVIKRENAAPKNREDTSHQLMFDLDFNTEASKGLYSINCTEKGNISRFINHSEDSNLNVYSVWINWSDPHIYHVALFAARDILAGEEITFTRSHSNQSKSVMENQL